MIIQLTLLLSSSFLHPRYSLLPTSSVLCCSFWWCQRGRSKRKRNKEVFFDIEILIKTPPDLVFLLLSVSLPLWKTFLSVLFFLSHFSLSKHAYPLYSHPPIHFTFLSYGFSPYIDSLPLALDSLLLWHHQKQQCRYKRILKMKE